MLYSKLILKNTSVLIFILWFNWVNKKSSNEQSSHFYHRISKALKCMHRLVKGLYKIYYFPLRTHWLTEPKKVIFPPMDAESQGVTQRLQFRGHDSDLAAQTVTPCTATGLALLLTSDSQYLTGEAGEDLNSKYFTRGSGNSPLLCPSLTLNILIYIN